MSFGVVQGPAERPHDIASEFDCLESKGDANDCQAGNQPSNQVRQTEPQATKYKPNDVADCFHDRLLKRRDRLLRARDLVEFGTKLVDFFLAFRETVCHTFED